jgi:hypothetical protein
MKILMGCRRVAVCAMIVGVSAASAEIVGQYGLQLERQLALPPLSPTHEWRALDGMDIAKLMPSRSSRSAALKGPPLDLSELIQPRGASRPEPLPLLEAWLAALAARDDWWLARVRDVMAGPAPTPQTPRRTDDTARQAERAQQIFVERLAELEALTGPLGARNLPFIQITDLLVCDPADQTGTRDFLYEGLARIDQARERLGHAIEQQRFGGRQEDVAYALVDLVAAWRSAYRIGYTQVIRQARLEDRSGRAAPYRLPAELFKADAPRF